MPPPEAHAIHQLKADLGYLVGLRVDPDLAPRPVQGVVDPPAHRELPRPGLERDDVAGAAPQIPHPVQPGREPADQLFVELDLVLLCFPLALRPLPRVVDLAWNSSQRRSCSRPPRVSIGSPSLAISRPEQKAVYANRRCVRGRRGRRLQRCRGEVVERTFASGLLRVRSSTAKRVLVNGIRLGYEEGLGGEQNGNVSRQELLDPSKAWWGGRPGRLADRPRYSISLSLGVVPLGTRALRGSPPSTHRSRCWLVATLQDPPSAPTRR